MRTCPVVAAPRRAGVGACGGSGACGAGISARGRPATRRVVGDRRRV